MPDFEIVRTAAGYIVMRGDKKISGPSNRKDSAFQCAGGEAFCIGHAEVKPAIFFVESLSVLHAGNGHVGAALVSFELGVEPKSSGANPRARGFDIGRPSVPREGATFEDWHALPCARHWSVNRGIISARADVQRDVYRTSTGSRALFRCPANGAAGARSRAAIGRCDALADGRAPSHQRRPCHHRA